MKRKDIETLAKKIVKCELTIRANEDKDKVRKAQQEIINITKGVKSISDLMEIDEVVAEMLEKKLKNFLTFQKFFDIIFT